MGIEIVDPTNSRHRQPDVGNDECASNEESGDEASHEDNDGAEHDELDNEEEDRELVNDEGSGSSKDHKVIFLLTTYTENLKLMFKCVRSFDACLVCFGEWEIK